MNIHATIWMNLENIMLSENIQSPKLHPVWWFSLDVICRRGKSSNGQLETESRLVIAGGWRSGGMEVTGNGYRVSSGCDENVPKLVVVVAQLRECTKTHHTAHFEWMNCVVCELYLNITIFLKKLVNMRPYLKHIYTTTAKLED